MLAKLLFLNAALSLAPTYRLRLLLGYFLLSRQEKVTKEKATPSSGPGCAGVPSLRRCCSGLIVSREMTRVCNQPGKGFIAVQVVENALRFSTLRWLMVR